MESLSSVSEIRRSYRQADNKKEQIKILAELNAVRPKVIAEILRRAGEKVPVEMLPRKAQSEEAQRGNEERLEAEILRVIGEDESLSLTESEEAVDPTTASGPPPLEKGRQAGDEERENNDIFDDGEEEEEMKKEEATGTEAQITADVLRNVLEAEMGESMEGICVNGSPVRHIEVLRKWTEDGLRETSVLLVTDEGDVEIEVG